MKNFKSLLIVLFAIVAVVLFLGTKSVDATSSDKIVLNPSSTTSNNTSNSTSNNTTNTLNTTNTSTNLVNTTTTNNVNSDLTKDLPKTGETDTYIIAGIGVIALAIGTVAFIKSKNM